MTTQQPTVNQQQNQPTERPNKFDMAPDDLKFFDTKEELEQYCQEKHPQRKIVWG